MWSPKARHRSNSSRTHRSIAALIVLAMTASMLTIPVSGAGATENGVDDLLGALGTGGDPTHNLAAWTSGLGTIGKLGEQLPLVTASAGGLLGFADLFEEAVTDELSSATTFSDLNKDQDITIGGGRTGHLTTTVSDFEGGKKLDLLVTVNRTVTGQDLHLGNDTPKVDLTISDGITVDLKSRLELSLVWTGTADDKVYLVSGPTGPRIDVDAYASVVPGSATAALGILGVSLTGSTLDLKAHFVGRVSDPNNDGKLFFTEGTGDDGELAQEGSPAGLVSFGLDPDGSQPIDSSHPGSRGSLAASFQLGAADAAPGLALPTNISATVGVNWPDIGTGSPSVTAPDLATTIGKFQNMSLKDLAAGLAQVIVGIGAIQQARFDPDATPGGPEIGDLDLPFMRGKLSDAVEVAAKLKDFLAANTIPAPGQEGFDPLIHDPAQAGNPTFTSLQDLLAELEDAAGITLSGLNWDTDTSKLSLTLAMTQSAPTDAVDLDEVSIEASGTTATYGANTLEVSGAGWSENQWLGRRVIAGGSAGEVASNDSDTITLQEDWIGGTPATNTPYVIAGAEPHVGAVTFADRIDDGSGHGLVNANAEQTFATVKPSYATTVTLALDLQDPKTGSDCVGFEGNTDPCPFTRTDGPLQTEVSSLPLPTDRVMLRTGSNLFHADFPIETAVDFTANAGFFKVQLGGNLEVCSSSLGPTCPDGTATGHMMSLGLEPVGDAQNDVRMSELFARLVDDPASLLDVDVNVRAYGALNVSLPDASNFLPAGASTNFTATWDDLTDPTSVDLDTSDLTEIFKLDFDANDPQALFTLLIRSLQTLSQSIADANTSAGADIFSKEIPGLGKSLKTLLTSDEANAGLGVTYGANSVTDTTRSAETNTLFPENLAGRTVIVGTQIGVVEDVSDNGLTLTMTENWESEPVDGTAYAMRSALDDATDRLLAAPPDNVQDAVELLNSMLGNDNVNFRYLETSGVGNLVLDLDWARDYRAGSPVKLQLPSLGKAFAGEATGLAQVEMNGLVDVGLVIPLVDGDGPADATALKILEDSLIRIDANAQLNAVVHGVIGPLSIALGNPAGSERAQAKADLSLELSKSGAQEDTPVSFQTFMSQVGVNFNATNSPVDCGEGLDTDLMVCARLPMFLKNTSSGPWTSIGEIALRLPDSTEPADLFNFSGDLPDDPEPKLEIPGNLATEIANAILDFGNLGDGLEAYLARIEQAFRLASFEGRLPLIGEDLQKGADFIGDLRTQLRNSIWNNLPGGGRPADATVFEEFINDELADALDAADIHAANISVEFECDAVLEQVAPPPTVTPTSQPTPTTTPPTIIPTQQYKYKVVAFQGDGNQPNSDTIPSGESGAATNRVALNADNYNTVEWDEVDHATGYKILRWSTADPSFKLIDRVGETDNYEDDGGAGSDYPPVTEEPFLDPCPGENIDGVFLEFDAARGNVTTTHGCQSSGAPQPCIGVDVPLDIGIPGLSLRSGVEGTNGIQTDIGFELHFRLGLNKQDGFFVATHDAWGPDNRPDPELQIGLGFDLPSSMVAEIAFIKINVNKATGAGHDPSLPLFAGAFQLDLKSSASEGGCFTGSEGSACTANDDAKLKFADIGTRSLSDAFGISLNGTFHIDWIIDAGVDSALPGVRANFQLEWDIVDKSPTATGPAGFGTPTIEFLDVGISAGAFFEGLLGEVVQEMKRVTGPIQPVIDTLYAPIPVLSDLSRLAGGGDVTLISLAQDFSTLTGGPDLEFVDTIKSIIEFINRLPTCATECFVPLGSFTVNGGAALETANSPTTADDMYQTTTPQDGEAVKSALNTKNDNTAAAGETLFGAGSAEGDVEKSGFEFPILDDPLQAFNLLMGGDVDLVTFDSGKLSIGFTWRQEFGPVYAPPPVMVTLAGSASASLRVRAGLDTYGIRKTVEAIQNGAPVDAVTAMDGLYLATVDEGGNPIPVLTLTGEIAAGAAVSVLIIKVGIEGGLKLEIAFYWNDPNDDGKFRISEFGYVALTNPVCLFVMRGRLSLFLRLYITFGIGIFSHTESFTIADVTLLDFTVEPDCDPPPPKLGGVTGDTLVVYAGRHGSTDFRGHAAWSNLGADYDKDTVKVIALHFAQKPGDLEGIDPRFDGFAVEMLGERREYLDEDLVRVVVDGTGYTKPMTVTFIGDGKKETDPATAGDSPTEFDKAAVVIGSDNTDVISTGTGPSFVDGRGGDDTIVTKDTGTGTSNAWVAGGGGVDKITVGNGDNQVAGDASLGSDTDTFDLTHNAQDGGGTKTGVTVIDWTSLANPVGEDGGSNQGNDVIHLGLGLNRARGNEGGDTISVATDAPDGSLSSEGNTLIGDGGNDKLTGGTAADRIFTAAETEFGVDEAGPADAGATNIVETGEGNDDVWGSTGVDLVTSHSTFTQAADIRGGAGNDILIGGYGTDEVYGGPDQDYVIAEPSEVVNPAGDEIINGRNYGPKWTVNHLPLPQGITPNTKTLVGGLGNDHIIGGDGTATMFGDRRINAELCAAGDPVASDPVAESTTASDGDGNDIVFGGAGVDTMSTAGADDIMYGKGLGDFLCGQSGDDVTYSGDGVDNAWGGSGVDLTYGDTAGDFLFGNDGTDTIYGGTADDIVEGNDGRDWISGGAHNDVVYGGTRASGRADTDDDLYGDTGTDLIIGDNGTVTDPYPFDLAGTVATAGGGDRIHGGANEDDLYGGLAGDTINGNDNDDYAEGNNGIDTIHGNAGEDVLIGGSSQEASTGVGRPDTGDIIFGDGQPDLIAGDNAILTIVATGADATPVTRFREFASNHHVQLLDLGESPDANNSGNDRVEGGSAADVVYGQSGHDRLKGNSEDDYVEGGPAIDWIEGNEGADDLVGGSSTALSGSGVDTAGQPDAEDGIYGGPSDDVIVGDNGLIRRPADGEVPTRSTVRLSAVAGEVMTGRIVELYDRRNGGDFVAPPPAHRFGPDRISGGEGVDVAYGLDGNDFVSGGAHDDYLEGGPGADVIRGDLALDATSSVTTVDPLADPGWPGAASGSSILEGSSTPDGQDDVIAGSSAPGIRDGNDTIEGNGADDYVLGDNGSLVRTVNTVGGVSTEAVYTDRYPNGAVPPTATRSRKDDTDLPGPSTRFCAAPTGTTCEVSGAFGDDTMHGQDGEDTLYGQDGNDTMFGNDHHDLMYGELGNDTMFGGNHEDTMLGDRGGARITYLDTGDEPAQFSVTLKQVPQESFTSFRRGSRPAFVDLLHDVDGNQFVGSATSAPMARPGLTQGGNDRMRGGADNDQLHGGIGNDLMNGDSGGDVSFGDDGDDLMWGGKGCDPVLNASTTDCLTGGTFDPSARGTNDRFVDHTFGGVHADVIDFQPRGSYPGNCAAGSLPELTPSGVIDPCVWFEMTDKHDADTTNSQHHHGTDWIYGGWDRDVMQGNVAGNGPNPGDRLIDWTGAYNLYTHCNAAYGGYNDIRQHSPDMEIFLTKLAWGDGAGQVAADVTTSGTSAYRELAFAYRPDFKLHANGPAHDGTPGHFNDPDSCSD